MTPIDLSDIKGNWIMERYFYEQTDRKGWAALAEAFGWTPWDEPVWMRHDERREFWREINRQTGGKVGRWISRFLAAFRR